MTARCRSQALLSAAAVRQRCETVFAAARRDETPHFRLDCAQLDAVADHVASLTRRRYPDLAVPYHSRWRHFCAAGIDRAALVAPAAEIAEQARARLDLAVVSVLLDAGAGPLWRFCEAETGRVLRRSEGLAVASLRAMQHGGFSADRGDPWRADAAALQAITTETLGEALQHGPGNELPGLESRARLLRGLGEVCAADPVRFGRPPRPGHLYDYWRGLDRPVAAAEILQILLHELGPIWPGRISIDKVPLGDCGRHRAVPGDGLVPFHKLSQWLAYSLIEPLQAGGVEIAGLDALTGLAEYRNGGLFVDCGVVIPRDRALATRVLDAASEPVVEWRALTVALLDRLAPRVRARLSKSEDEFPLACVLEGGSWAAGREIAFARRPDGRPPFDITSDGTVF
ncbi:MAG: URC4/urg3 family protein [Stellaceae bacterium]